MGAIQSKGFNPETLPDLTGKVFIVTGGNSGIGFATIRALLQKGAKVYMGARNEQRALDAITRLQSEGTPSGRVLWLPLDYSNPRDAKRAAEQFLEREERLDVVVNCAGLLPCAYERSADDISHIVVVNHLSPFVFITSLLPLLQKTAKAAGNDVRIVLLTSLVHSMTPNTVTFNSVEDFNKKYKGGIIAQYKRYNMTKFMVVLFAKELQRKMDAAGSSITVTAVHPGIVATEGVLGQTRTFGPIIGPVFATIQKTFLISPKRGGNTTLFAAASPIVHSQPHFKGAYIVPPGKLGTPHHRTLIPEEGRALWDTTEGVLRNCLIK